MPRKELDPVDTGITLEWLRTRADIARLSGPIAALMERVGAPPPSRLETIEPWFAHHPAVMPWGVLVRRRGEPVATLVLAHTRRFGIHRFVTSGYRGAAQGVPAVDRDAADLLARTLTRALLDLRQPWALDLRGLPDPDPALDALAAGFTRAVRDLGPPMARVYFSPDQPLSHYLSRNTRSAVAKALHRMARHGRRHDLAWTADPATIVDRIDELMDVHRRRGVQQFGMSPLDDRAVSSLFRATVQAHARAGRVHLLTLRIDGALAAFALCELTAGILWVDTNRASPDWLMYSPGTVVNAEILRWAHADPRIECVDWGGSVQRYKLSGHPTLVRLQRLRAWSSWWVRAVVSAEGLLRSAWTRGARSLTKRPMQAPGAPDQAAGRRIRNSWSGPISK